MQRQTAPVGSLADRLGLYALSGIAALGIGSLLPQSVSAQENTDSVPTLENRVDSSKVSSQKLYNSAMQHVGQRNYELAVRDFEEAYRLDPTSKNILVEVGAAYRFWAITMPKETELQKKEYVTRINKAIEVLTSYINEVEPTFGKTKEPTHLGLAYAHRGFCYLVQGEELKAKRDLTKSIEYAPDPRIEKVLSSMASIKN